MIHNSVIRPEWKTQTLNEYSYPRWRHALWGDFADKEASVVSGNSPLIPIYTCMHTDIRTYIHSYIHIWNAKYRNKNLLLFLRNRYLQEKPRATVSGCDWTLCRARGVGEPRVRHPGELPCQRVPLSLRIPGRCGFALLPDRDSLTPMRTEHNAQTHTHTHVLNEAAEIDSVPAWPLRFHHHRGFIHINLRNKIEFIFP